MSPMQVSGGMASGQGAQVQSSASSGPAKSQTNSLPAGPARQGATATSAGSSAAPGASTSLPKWDDAEISKRLEMNEILLTEWQTLMDNTAKLPREKLPVNDCMKHHVLKKRVHDNLGRLAKIVQVQLKQGKRPSPTAAITAGTAGAGSQGTTDSDQPKKKSKVDKKKGALKALKATKATWAFSMPQQPQPQQKSQPQSHPQPQKNTSVKAHSVPQPKTTAALPTQPGMQVASNPAQHVGKNGTGDKAQISIPGRSQQGDMQGALSKMNGLSQTVPPVNSQGAPSQQPVISSSYQQYQHQPQPTMAPPQHHNNS